MNAILSPEPLKLPAERLLGMVTPEGWKVVELINPSRGRALGQTGGTFSVGYRVERENQKHAKVFDSAFLKALDIDRGLQLATNLADELREKLNEFDFEKKMHEFCRDRHMSRVVRVIEAGELKPVAEPNDKITQVPFLVLEIADQGDARSWVRKISSVETTLKLAYLHHVMTGIQQLHRATVAHSDLKPSNVMIFTALGAKIGDLGRVINGTGTCPFSGVDYPGDWAYAPPEILYRSPQSDWVNGRERIDLYQWGALCAYLFSGVELNTWLVLYLDSSVQPDCWGGAAPSYTAALPYLIEAFEKVLERLGDEAFPEWASDALVALIRETAHPNCVQRGDAGVVRKDPSQTGIDRLISRLNVLAKQAAVHVRIGDNMTRAEMKNGTTP